MIAKYLFFYLIHPSHVWEEKFINFKDILCGARIKSSIKIVFLVNIIAFN